MSSAGAAEKLDPEVQIAEIVTLVRDVLGADAVGAYLYGSATVGGLRPRSDLDVLVVSRRPTTAGEQRRIVDALLASSCAAPDQPRRPVELAVVVHAEVHPWRYPPRFDLRFGDWMRDRFEAGELHPWPARTDPDLAVAITQVLVGGRTLLGRPPAEVLDAVPARDVLDAVVGDVPSLRAHLPTDTTNVLLTLARIWTTLATHTICPKDVAAAWTLDRLPPTHRPVVAHARAVYRGDVDEGWADLAPGVDAAADHLVDRIGEQRRTGTGRPVPPLRLADDLAGVGPGGVPSPTEFDAT